MKRAPLGAAQQNVYLVRSMPPLVFRLLGFRLWPNSNLSCMSAGWSLCGKAER
jgi:hypothetical protein